ncbi:uncharacterized protein LOC132287144 isoform X2 [Cornus florida]|uniref:uncharacterized protein LOC132287144 isoform X2 n=1 Tax=Cornus florida TaxID=4283 RepID=UPI00289CA11B|nr:uncharacterized protein LOC132287144 isoform X2 [Cornus florida]
MFVCLLKSGYPGSDIIQIKPEYSGVIDETQTITVNHLKPTGVSATKFRDESIATGQDIVLRIFKNNRETEATLNPSHLVDYVVIVIKPEKGKIAMYGKVARNGDFLRRIPGIGSLLSREYSSRRLEPIPIPIPIPQGYQVEGPESPEEMLTASQRVIEESAPAIVEATHDAEEGINIMLLREEQDAAYRAALEADQARECQIKEEQERIEREAAEAEGKQKEEEEAHERAAHEAYLARMQPERTLLLVDDLEKGSDVTQVADSGYRLPRVIIGLLRGR